MYTRMMTTKHKMFSPDSLRKVLKHPLSGEKHTLSVQTVLNLALRLHLLIKVLHNVTLGLL